MTLDWAICVPLVVRSLSVVLRTLAPKSLKCEQGCHTRSGSTGPERGSDATQLGSARTGGLRQVRTHPFIGASGAELIRRFGFSGVAASYALPRTPYGNPLEAKHVYPACLTDNECSRAEFAQTILPIDVAAN